MATRKTGFGQVLAAVGNSTAIVGLGGAVAMVCVMTFGWLATQPVTAEPADGRELFVREWQPHDPRSHGGDGLGPVFNESSCVACHNQGGMGGGGAKAKNVMIITPLDGGTPNGRGPQQAGPSFVLHHFGTDGEYAGWRAQHLPFGQFELPDARSGIHAQARVPRRSPTQRQTPALFGAGLIDALPNDVLRALAAVRHPEFPEVSGRVAETASGSAGRFGWKGQMARLDEFVITACAVELGLQVPGKPQPTPPHRAQYTAPGLDMNQAECDALVRFVQELPRPQQQPAQRHAAGPYLAQGQALFEVVGCATCHTAKVGAIDGIYSDLLLHDMGAPMSDAGSSYGVFQPSNPSPPPSTAPLAESGKKPPAIATPSEWRTPPLWGVRDSAPYLHDGRADTLAVAIALHDGEAQKSRDYFQKLPHEGQQKIIGFLKSLAAPQ